MSEDLEKAKVEVTTNDKIEAIKDTPEFAAYLNAHGKLYLDSQEGELGRKYTGQALNMIDKNLMKALGIEEKDKPKGKTGDWINSIALENVKLREQLANDEKATGNDNTDLKLLHDNQIVAMQKIIDESKEANSALLLASQAKDISNSLAIGLQDATFDPMYSKKILGQLIKGTKEELLANHKMIDGKAVFYKEDGGIYEHLNGLPMSAKEVANEAFKHLFKTKEAGGNAKGSDSDGSSAAAVVKGDILVMPNAKQIKNFGEFNKEFTKKMQAKGWASHEERTIKLQKATQDYYFPDGLMME